VNHALAATASGQISQLMATRGNLSRQTTANRQHEAENESTSECSSCCPAVMYMTSSRSGIVQDWSGEAVHKGQSCNSISGCAAGRARGRRNVASMASATGKVWSPGCPHISCHPLSYLL